MGLGQNFFTRVGLGRVRSAIYESGKFPPPPTPIFSLQQDQKISSGRVKKLLGQGQVGPFFTFYKSLFRSGQSPSLAGSKIRYVD